MSSASPRLQVEGFHDAATGTVSYLVLDAASRRGALVDSVLDFDAKSGRTGTAGARRLVDRVRELEAEVEWLLETHVHADHLSAAPYLRAQLGGRLGIGRHVTTVQQVFGPLFNADASFEHDGASFDRLFDDAEGFAIGGLRATAMHTPGHTPACMTYVVSDGVDTAALVGDTLFRPDHGTARCDFPGGDAATLYRSIGRVLALPDATRLHLCHDYPLEGRAPSFVHTVAEQRRHNVHWRDGIGEAEFVALRNARDATLEMPALMLPSVQVNLRGGQLPAPGANGIRYLKIPLDTF